ncbi:DUF1801 domain-containing protein [Hoeflea prorocentri]|uniref:DUF1801 domain-containing protein n=1 Tax=Hoeflea prorocentri TaxID=1922333 RepID=A0A9X3ZHD4_9HYPH|nr:DUF1801 domain-containing protein [Hoeflea prorocentri]MCY6380788.1 DUF1801 domain-containing protein [Hoeflea prorocentri]MDA5398588.1 DUF1801 domain-containing protein [Hoeflea prorocentri]
MSVFQSDDVEAIFTAYPDHVRDSLLSLRELVFETAGETQGVGQIEETLKWGEPSYLTSRPKSGSTIRIGWHDDKPDHCSVFFHCQTDLIATCRELYGQDFEFEGNRRLSYRADGPQPTEALKHCLALALTYHSRKRKS